MVTPDPRVYLLHIRDCCERVIECGTTPAHILLDAACRNLEILGEASRKIGPDFRAAHPQVPWREMSDLRNVLIHNYAGPTRQWSGHRRPRDSEGSGRRDWPARLSRAVKRISWPGTRPLQSGA